MKVLVTGGSGFIGRHLAVSFPRDWVVKAPGRLELDLSEEDRVEAYLKQERFDAVVHAATWNATNKSDKDLSQVLKQNLRMFLCLRRGRRWFGKLVYYGSGAEFDRRQWRSRMPETWFGKHLPADDYGLSKFAMECSHGSCDPVWNLRLFGVYGPHEDWRIRFISHACCRALFDLPIVIHQNRRFDYTWVEDIVEVTRRVLEEEVSARTLNVSAGEPRELFELAKMVLKAADKELPIQIEEPGMGREYSADVTLLGVQLPGLRFTPLQTGISRLYRWYCEHRDLVSVGQL
jgi:UDP-glucose 4-epimerase